MDKLITLIVKPISTACNLRCIYCYHDWNREEYSDSLKMRSDILGKLILDCRELNQSSIKFIWHGGEPLLAGISFYEEALGLQKKLLGENFRIINSMQTNGVLATDCWARFLSENNFRMGISLDGPAQIHDKYRIDRKGKGTFERVIGAIDKLKSYGSEVGIVSVVTKDSIGQEKEIFDFFYDKGLYRMNFSPFVEPESPVFSLSDDDFADFMNRVFDLWIGKNDGRVKIQLLDSFLQGLIGGRATVCWCQQDCSNFLSVNSNGDVYFCGRFLGFSELKLGNIVESSLGRILNSPNYKHLQNLLISRNEHCRSCKWANICNGGCAFHCYNALKREFGGYYFCKATQKILEHMEEVVGSLI